MSAAYASDSQGLEEPFAGAVLEVHCTDPLSVIDIPNLARKTGDMITIMERTEQRIVFLIEKANRAIGSVNASPSGGERAG